MNSLISDIALDLGPFALDLEFEDGTSNDCGVTAGGRDAICGSLTPLLGPMAD